MAEGGRPMRRLCRYAAPVVLAHAVVVFWHLELLARRDAVLKVDQVPLFRWPREYNSSDCFDFVMGAFSQARCLAPSVFGRAAGDRWVFPFSESWFRQCIQDGRWRIDVRLSDQRGPAISA